MRRDLWPWKNHIVWRDCHDFSVRNLNGHKIVSLLIKLTSGDIPVNRVAVFRFIITQRSLGYCPTVISGSHSLAKNAVRTLD